MSRIDRLALSVLMACATVFPALAAISPFQVIDSAGHFELVENTGRVTSLMSGTSRRCFIRSTFDPAAPTVFIYPSNQKWNIQLPDDVFTAAEWEDRHIKTPGYRGLPVHFRVGVDGGKSVELTQYVKALSPHKKRYITFPEPEASTVYAFMQAANTLEVDWKHESIGSRADKLLREALDKPVALGQARYDASGIPTLMQSYQEKCTK